MTVTEILLQILAELKAIRAHLDRQGSPANSAPPHPSQEILPVSPLVIKGCG